MRAAATSEPEIAELARTHDERRLEGQRKLVLMIAEAGGLRAGLSIVYFALTSPELHRLLTVDLGWSGRRCENWLAARPAVELLPG